MMMDRLTQKSREALQTAQAIAREHSHQELDGPHLALALARQSDTIVPTLLQRTGVDLSAFEDDLKAELDRRANVDGVSASDIFLGRDLKQAFDKAEDEAGKLGDEYLSAEHLLLGLLKSGGSLEKIFSKHTVCSSLWWRFRFFRYESWCSQHTRVWKGFHINQVYYW